MPIAALALVTALLLSTILLDWHQKGVSRGMYRSYVLVAGVGLLALVAIPNWWLRGLGLIMLLNWASDPMMGAHLARVMPFVIFLTAGALVLPMLTVEAVPYLLGSMVLAGVALSIHAVQYAVERRKLKGRVAAMHTGQENVNNTQSVSVVCTSAAIGLAVGYSPWWWLAVPLVALPIWFTAWLDWRRERTVTMGPVLMAGVGLMSLPLVLGWWSLTFVPVVLTGLAWSLLQAIRHEKWWDSGRVRCWYTTLLTGWWIAGWKVRLLGRGWQSWVGFQDFLVDMAKRTNRQHIVNTKFMMSTAHNEFVHLTFEHGLIGLLLLLGYCATALWSLGTGGPEAVAVYFVAVGMIGVACTLHPWTWTHGTLSECDEHGKPVEDGTGYKLFTIGSPALNWLALIVALLVEVVR